MESNDHEGSTHLNEGDWMYNYRHIVVFSLQELQSFIQTAYDGVIIFSLGSYCSITEQSMADMFAEALSQVSQKVVWKAKGKVPQRIPSNVKMMNYIPQNDLLGKICCVEAKNKQCCKHSSRSLENTRWRVHEL